MTLPPFERSKHVVQLTDDEHKLVEKVQALSMEMTRQGLELCAIEYRRGPLRQTLTIETVSGPVTVTSRDVIESTLRWLGR